VSIIAVKLIHSYTWCR